MDRNNFETDNWKYTKSKDGGIVIETKREEGIDIECLELSLDSFSDENYQNTISSILNSNRLEEMEKHDLICNINKIQKLLIKEERKLMVMFTKSGGTAKGKAITNRITLPTSWVADMGIKDTEKEEKYARVYYTNKKIIIEKY